MSIVPTPGRSTRSAFLRWIIPFVVIVALAVFVAGTYPFAHVSPPVTHSHSVADDPTPTPTPPRPPCGGGVPTPCQ
jgi:hypothetical protein